MMHPLNEATDKAEFLRWIGRESLISAIDDSEVNRICQQWIKHKIRLAANSGSAPVTQAREGADHLARLLMDELNTIGNGQDAAEEHLSRALATYFRQKLILAETASQ